MPAKPAELIEPFAGGASIGLTAAAEGLVDHVTLVELDPAIAVVWQVVINGDAQALAKRITKFSLSEESAKAELAKKPRSDVGKAFQTILRNRVQRGGIMAPGAGLMKSGENGKGIGSRWYPETLARRITDIESYRDRITVICGDALAVMEDNTDRSDAVLFIDPPYTAGGKRAGARLYENNALDHERLFTLAAQHSGDILLTYDNASAVEKLASEHGLVTRPIAMRSTHNANMSELLIGRDLSWVAP